MKVAKAAAAAAASALKSKFGNSAPQSLRSKQLADNQQRGPRSGTDAEHYRLLRNDVSTAELLTAFAQDFAKGLDDLMVVVDKLAIACCCLDDEQRLSMDTITKEVKAYVWALASGVKATAPQVSRETKRRGKQLEELHKASSEACEALEKKSAAQQERNHYLLKLQTLREEAQDRYSRGQATSADQAQRIQRNEAKLARSQQVLDRTETIVQKRLRENAPALISAFHGLVQTVSCGWFVSTGAVVCRTLNQTDADASPAPSQSPASESLGSVVAAIPSSSHQDSSPEKHEVVDANDGCEEIDAAPAAIPRKELEEIIYYESAFEGSQASASPSNGPTPSSAHFEAAWPTPTTIAPQSKNAADPATQRTRASPTATPAAAAAWPAAAPWPSSNNPWHTAATAWPPSPDSVTWHAQPGGDSFCLEKDGTVAGSQSFNASSTLSPAVAAFGQQAMRASAPWPSPIDLNASSSDGMGPAISTGSHKSTGKAEEAAPPWPTKSPF
eukprot:TRINITY_DN18912_c0_g1_i1.p1 TRINITY_DN18912_c0_g1~~TRINITY_DN18912_c0_g1_i1.p1  ORF type:complete len:521 (-),score=78.35 TRINITY_DN18912_c0_g1_i1:238-1740(-)